MKRLLLTMLAITMTAMSWAQCTGTISTNSSNDPTFTFTFNTTAGQFDTWWWDFGDGASGVGQTVTHTYATNGAYAVCVWAVDSLGNSGCFYQGCDSVLVSNGNPVSNCSADFGYYDSLGTIYYFDQSTGSNLNYYWDFGDGTSSTAQNPNHTYSAPGSYVTCLTIWNNNCSDTLCNIVNVTQNTSCDADFASYDSSGTVYFWNQSTGSSPSYFWDFGDGQWSTSTNPQHTYSAPGSYVVCLTISTPNCSDTLCNIITVGSNTTCDADFFIYQDSANPTNYYAVNMSSGSNLTYTWSWGDGSTSTGAYPSHTYASPGTYGICLTVDDGMGCTDWHCDTITYVPMQGGSFTVNVVPGTSNAIEETLNEVTTNVYPNPTTGNFSIEMTAAEGANTTITIVDVSGRTVFNESTYTTGTSIKQIDASNWNSGIYMIRIQPENGVPTTTRIVKR